MTCSFCGKPQEEVKKLIAGLNGVFICDECIGLCAEIVSAELSGQLTPNVRKLDPSLSGRTTLTGVTVPPMVVDDWMSLCLSAFGCRLVPPHSLEYEILAVEMGNHSTFVAEVTDLDATAVHFRALGEFSEETARDLAEMRVIVFKNGLGNEALLFQRKG